jgi:hypothetical protein
MNDTEEDSIIGQLKIGDSFITEAEGLDLHETLAVLAALYGFEFITRKEGHRTRVYRAS